MYDTSREAMLSGWHLNEVFVNSSSTIKAWLVILYHGSVGLHVLVHLVHRNVFKLFMNSNSMSCDLCT